jgi:hypothetical protein
MLTQQGKSGILALMNITSSHIIIITTTTTRIGMAVAG